MTCEKTDNCPYRNAKCFMRGPDQECIKKISDLAEWYTDRANTMNERAGELISLVKDIREEI